MERTIAYDPSRQALFHPERAPTPLRAGRMASEDQLCAEFSRLVYSRFERSEEARDRLRAILVEAGFPEVRFINVEGTDAFVATDAPRRITILVFRGTEQGLRDLAIDLSVALVPFGTAGKVHAGFARALNRALSEVERALATAAPRVIFTGHSLGAALATLCAGARRPDRLVTFGSPRVGDGEFVRSLEGLSISRYVNCCDYVCWLPPKFFSFRHAEPGAYIDRLGMIRGSPEPLEVRQDQKQARREYYRRYGWRIGTVWIRGFADHAPINYVSALFGLPARTDPVPSPGSDPGPGPPHPPG